MAYTATQRAQVYQFLGYAAIVSDANGDPVVNDALDAKIDASEDGDAIEATVTALLTRIVAVDTAINTSSSAAQARGALKAIVGDAEFYDIPALDRFMTAAEYGRLLVDRLRQRLSVESPLPSDYFGEGATFGAGIAGGSLVTWP